MSEVIMARKLHALLAVEKMVKGNAERSLTDAYHTLKKGELFNGLTRTYAPLDEAGEKRPPESKLVQFSVNGLIDSVKEKLTSLFDVVASKDVTNGMAKASVVVGGQVLLADVPVTTLLFLEKKLVDLHTFVGSLPTLDPNFSWKWDENNGRYTTEPTSSGSKQKRKEHKVIVQATDKFPAQTQLVEDEVLVGYWTESKQSSALPKTKQLELLQRVNLLLAAVKTAREEANSIEVQEKEIGAKVLTYVFG